MASTKTVLFNDGEVMSFADLNLISQGATKRAWDVPGYADTMGDALPRIIDGEDFGDCFDTPDVQLGGVYTKGGGLQPSSSGLDSNIGAGFVGGYYHNLPPSSFGPKMRWAFITKAAAIGFTHVPTGVGLFRWDYVEVECNENDSDAESQDFKDEVTGAISTSSLSKRRSLELTFSVNQGTPGADPIFPTLTSGKKVVCAFKVSDTAIVETRDLTWPFGPTISCIGAGTNSFRYGAGAQWVPLADQGIGQVSAAAPGDEILLVPPMHFGDPFARLIAIQLKHRLSPNALVRLARWKPNVGAETPEYGPNISFSFTRDSTYRFETHSLRSGPFASNSPMWCNGLKTKGLQDEGGVVLSVVCGDDGTDQIAYANWIFAKG